eukprot:TRINITY_DN45197_c0_g1_i1.p1 TRINITY_DN45197_c0_g1~~TRINITY_DN45197_c0_g1_i1.p1  ORF type:complete len:116 (-),score=0.23 TRINITY_DN45197_c0_g1_i1:511-858(-)
MHEQLLWLGRNLVPYYLVVTYAGCFRSGWMKLSLVQGDAATHVPWLSTWLKYHVVVFSKLTGEASSVIAQRIAQRLSFLAQRENARAILRRMLPQRQVLGDDLAASRLLAGIPTE